MSTIHRRHAISIDEAAHRAQRLGFSTAGPSGELGGIGLEQEVFALATGARELPMGRVPLEGGGGLYHALDRLLPLGGLRRGGSPAPGLREYQLGNGGRITFEPGGQLEHSTIVHGTVTSAVADLLRVREELEKALKPDGVTLAASGLDVWNSVDDVPLRLGAERYTAMTSAFDLRGRWGRVMMRHTASLQINLDLGPEGVWQERWRLANLLAPLVVATFAASPGPEGANTRALAWQRLDPSRTGFPCGVANTRGTAILDGWADAVLDADVMFVRMADGGWAVGLPGWSFRKWIEDGHPEHGWPTRDDLEYHLTTLFFEVRPRGFLEIRSCDSLPNPWWQAPVVLMTALLYDQRAREEALAILDGAGGHLAELWGRAARVGVRDPEIAVLAARVWETAMAGAERLPEGFLSADDVIRARSYLDHFTFRERMPADELAALADDPAGALAWAAGGTVELPPPERSIPWAEGDAAATCGVCHAV